MAICYNIIIKSLNYAAMAQVVEHVLGKDEVTSSNLVSSSNKKSKSNDLLFLFVFVSVGHNIVWALAVNII